MVERNHFDESESFMVEVRLIDKKLFAVTIKFGTLICLEMQDRYSNLATYYASQKAKLPDGGKLLPDFPPKLLFHTEASLENRRKNLEVCFTQMIRYVPLEDVFGSDVVEVLGKDRLRLL